MKTDIFDYDLPEKLIARYPAKERDQSRLLVLDRQTGQLSNHIFTEIIHYIEAGDLVVFNNSRVMAARLFGQKSTGAKLEFLIEKIIDDQIFISHIRANKALKIGSEILIADVPAQVLNKQNGLYMLKLHDSDVWQLMNLHGHIPLPPYMKRQDESFDAERYQTVYSKLLGSVAAPTAGLHFTQALLKAIREKGAETAYVTLHVGSGTFKPIQAENIYEHVMHSELINVPSSICELVRKTKANGKRVIAVGTTSVRSLESAAQSGEIKPFYGESDIFIYPGKNFHVVDAMVTNFHLPKSTLIMLVSAFASTDMIKQAYRHAIDDNYHFYSYGDAMFIY
ncbi:tRNA preQ1(34) S-adenosylmethionine ribosyltransferase-isomerase QueA [Fastidiosibacter lacustris]|uniref:tRNA preQ1(34) S-adenosylmethionine ribosyltransferase-isomerase QueA n=1 Tax=Fastidiosibacter lacustris TaxID=2056695 RepID=UPI000E34C2F8|nr:tRNA preQ1(34) S-adenosylmethionine ribosyltransferase-isomerase QueA [Fastidiosibacter lacustris]